ncbi:MAG: helix-turn-helix domain-containing protein [Caldilineaceae bacterium]
MQPTTFGSWLKKLRAEQDLTQERLSELVGCATPTLRSFEIGARRPSREMADRIAEVLKLPNDERSEFLRLARQAPERQRDLPNAPIDDEKVSSPLTSHTPALPLPHFTVPQSVGPLIGREAERNALRTLLLDERNRLVTIFGTGGMGKTLLALDVATQLTAHFTDGIVFVSLTPLRAAAHLPGAVASALQLPGGGDASQQINMALATRHLLLVLDGFEELLHQESNEATNWVNQLLQQTEHLQILITSRERLRLSSERSFELGGLSLPNAALPVEMSDAVLLFLDRAQQAEPEFRLDSNNKRSIARICQLVDGMPLGIELAAAWVNVLSPEEIASELESNIDFLARANRDTTPRHRSMRAVFDHSWSLLNAEEREIMGRLAVFRGGCQREAAQTVAKATLPRLAGLIDKSLIQRRQSGGHARYELHEVIRQYAAEKRRATMPSPSNGSATTIGLGQDEVWLAHYSYFYKLAATAKSHLYGSEQLQWLHVLDEEHANLRAALDRCLRTHDLVRGLQLALQLEEYWYIRGHHREGLQRLLDFLQQDPAQLSEIESANGYVAATILAIAGGNYSAALTYIERCLDTIRRVGDRATLAKMLRYRGLIALHEADYAAAETYASEAVAVASTNNNYSEVATTLTHLAEIALVQQNFNRAQALGEQAVQTLRLIEDKNQLAGSLRRLAQARIQLGKWEDARAEALESLALNNEVKDQRGTAASMVVVAKLLSATQTWAAVAQLLGAANYLLSQAQSSLLPADQLVYDELRQQLSANEPDFQKMLEAGRARMVQEAYPPYQLNWVEELFAE